MDIHQAKADIRELLGDDFTVTDRYEQQDDVFRIMKVEKLIAYLFLTFILLVACFNIIGSISMLIIDKKEDIRTLRNLGAQDNQIVRIFLFEGRMISGFGALIGIAFGLLLCYLQQAFGFITLGNSSGNFVVPSVPMTPQTVVIPARNSWEGIMGGTRVAGPPSPPPPVRCTC